MPGVGNVSSFLRSSLAVLKRRRVLRRALEMREAPPGYHGSSGGVPLVPRGFPGGPRFRQGMRRHARAWALGRHTGFSGSSRSSFCNSQGPVGTPPASPQRIAHSTWGRAKRSARDSARVVSSTYIYIYIYIYMVHLVDNGRPWLIIPARPYMHEYYI